MTSASGETASDESAYGESASGDLQNLFSSDAFLQHKLPFCRFHYSSFVIPKLMFDLETLKFLSIVLHTRTNISISN